MTVTVEATQSPLPLLLPLPPLLPPLPLLLPPLLGLLLLSVPPGAETVRVVVPVVVEVLVEVMSLSPLPLPLPVPGAEVMPEALEQGTVTVE